MQLTWKTGCWTFSLFSGKTPYASQAILRNQSDVTFMTYRFKQITDSLRAKRTPHMLIIKSNKI